MPQPIIATRQFVYSFIFLLSLSLPVSLLAVAEDPTTIIAADGPLPLYATYAGNYCSLSIGVGMSDRASAFISTQLPGEPISATLFWSGRDRDGKGDNTLWVNEVQLMADQANQAESGGGSWWHTYIVDATALIQSLVSPIDGSLTIEIGGLTFSKNRGGETHGATLHLIYEASHCPASRSNLHFGLDGFKHSATEPIFGPNSAVSCALVEPSNQSRLLELSLTVGGIENANRNSTIWVATTTGTEAPETLIGQNQEPLNALKFVDQLGNDPAQRQWDHFQTTLKIPAHHTQACMQIEGVSERGLSAVLVTFMARVLESSVDLPSITGQVWLDINRDGLIDATEAPIADQLVLLRNVAGNSIVRAVQTNELGEYHFSNLAPVAYLVDVIQELFPQRWIAVSEADDLLDTVTVVDLSPGQSIKGINFGFIPLQTVGTISGSLWQDSDGDGHWNEASDAGLADVSVLLLDSTQTLIAEYVTTASGAFTFPDLPLQPYRVQIRRASLAADLIQTFESDGSLDGMVDVDLTVAPAPERTELSFGYGTPGQIEGRLWADQNANGVAEPDELGINKALLLLTDSTGVGRVAVTQNDGFYRFGRLAPGEYALVMVLDTILPGAMPTFEIDDVLDGRVIIHVEISQVTANVDFGFDLGIRSSNNVAPRLDLSTGDVDLDDEAAILELIQELVQNGLAVDPGIDLVIDPVVNPVEPDEPSGTDEPTPDEAPLDPEPSTPPVPELSGNPVQEQRYYIHIPLIQ